MEACSGTFRACGLKLIKWGPVQQKQRKPRITWYFMNQLKSNYVLKSIAQTFLASIYLHEHLGRSQFHDQYHAYNQDHPSTMEHEQECQEHDL